MQPSSDVEHLLKPSITLLGVAPDSKSRNPKARNKAGAEPLLDLELRFAGRCTCRLRDSVRGFEAPAA